MRARLARLAFLLVAISCARAPTVAPTPGAATPEGLDASAPFARVEAVPDAGMRTAPGLATVGDKPAVVARRTPPPELPPCGAEGKGALSFEHPPTYTDRIDKGAPFSATLFVGSTARCTRRVALPLSFTPPKTTATRTVDFVADVPAGGALVTMRLDAEELAEANVVPGRYAITFAVFDEEQKPVGRALSGNPFRIGRDEVLIAAKPALPPKIGAGEDLVVPIAIQNVGDTANRVTPLIVFTRPGQTAGIEHYDPPELAVPGTSSHTFRLSAADREAEGIGPGSWLVTITIFDAAGERMNSFAGMPLTIGKIDLRLSRPELPSRVRRGEPIQARFRFENKGDTADKVQAIVALTKPGTTKSHEFVFTRDVPPGVTVFDAVIDQAARGDKGVGPGVWLVSTAAFESSGQRIKSFTGHYLEIEP